MPHQRLLARFLQYVQVNTTAGEPGGTYPSSPGQLELGRTLVAELRALGLADAVQDEHGIVLATVPGTSGTPAIVFNAHLDTSPETTGYGVKPQVIRAYPGGDIVLPGDPRQVIRVADNPELATLVGRTLITTDGTTLLGADDKAGVAVIMEAAERLSAGSNRPRATVRVCFTCDEEIGHGVDHVDLSRLAASACYTLDGEGTDQIDVETFSADLARVTVHGVNIHPSIAKGRMVNALRVAADFVTALPGQGDSPETTNLRQGFLHPYLVEGGVGRVTLRILLRDFDTPRLAERADFLRAVASRVEPAHPGSRIEVEITKQYRNLGDGLAKHPHVVQYAELAHRRLGRTPRRTIIRGGTDGSRLTELGLPTPNLSTGEHNPHSPLEWTCLEEMAAAADVLVELAHVWGEQPPPGALGR